MKLVADFSEQTPQTHLIALVGNNFLHFELAKNLTPDLGFQIMLYSTLLEFAKEFERAFPELVIINTHLPDRPGLEILELWRRKNISIPLIFITKNPIEQYADILRQHDFVQVIRSPVPIERLIESIQSALPYQTSVPDDVAPFMPTDYLQMAEYGKYSVKIELFRNNKSIGHIIVVGGLPWSALTDERQGLEAFKELVSCEADYVTCRRFDTSQKGPQTLFGTAEHLLLEVFRQTDESNKEKSRFFSSLELDKVPLDMFEESISTFERHDTPKHLHDIPSEFPSLDKDVAAVEVSETPSFSTDKPDSFTGKPDSLFAPDTGENPSFSTLGKAVQDVSSQKELTSLPSFDDVTEPSFQPEDFLLPNGPFVEDEPTHPQWPSMLSHPSSEKEPEISETEESSFTLHPIPTSSKKPKKKKKKRTFTLHPIPQFHRREEEEEATFEEENPWDTSSIEDTPLSEFDELFEEGLDALLEKNYTRAFKIFCKAKELKPEDGRVKANLERLKDLGYSK